MNSFERLKKRLAGVSGAVEAAAVELGTASSEPRPFLGPAMAEQRASVGRKAADAAREEIMRRCGR